MGVVYEATQLSLNRTVAMKLLATHLGEDPAFRERFRREGLLQAAIDHPNIVTVYEAGETEEGLFLAMRMVRGPNLKDMIVSRELDAGRTLRILSPIADALDTAHAAGLIHRDIKPQNILVGGRDHAYLADFGLTKAPGEKSLTKTGQFVGTLDYISPEQIRGLPASKMSDIYALAAVLYECLTGVVPYPKDSEAAVLYAHMSDEPPAVTEQRPELPGELDEVIKKAMAKEPEQRHQSAGELLEDAEHAFGRKTRAALRPPGPIETPQEAGIRGPESQVPTRESKAQQSDELRAAAASAGATAAGSIEATRAQGAIADQTQVAGPGATQLGSTPAPDATRAASAPPPDATRAASAPPPDATRAAAAATTAGTAPPPQTYAPPRKAGLSPALIAIAAAVVVAAAVAGFVLGGSGGEESEGGGSEFTQSASAGALTLGFPDDWQRGDAREIEGLEIGDSLGLAPTTGEGGLVAGQTQATGPTLLPAAFLKTLPSPPARDDTVKLGDNEAYRYAGLKPKGFDGEMNVYVSPNDSGVATIACYAPTTGPVLDQCEQIAGSLTLNGVDPVSLGPNPDYASGAKNAIDELNKARGAARTRLSRATRAAGQADAANDLARAYATAAGAFQALNASPQDRPANDAIVKALKDTSGAYEDMARGAQRNDPGQYNSARERVRRGEAAVQKAIRGLAQLGYRV